MTNTPPTPANEIIIGLDPGTNLMGWGVILIQHRQLHIKACGVIQLGKYSTHALKLKKIFERVQGLVEEFAPDHVALEAPFYGQNVQSMLKLGRAQGVAMAAALSHEVPITEYAPKKVKQSVTGNGNASKEQVAAMLKTLLRFDPGNMPLDATDALAVAVCHHFQRGQQSSRAKSWGTFLKDNPNRLK